MNYRAKDLRKELREIQDDKGMMRIYICSQESKKEIEALYGKKYHTKAYR